MNKEDELHMAIRDNNEDKIKCLICKENVDINCTYYGMTPLLVAISKGLSDMAVWLITQGCDVHKLDVSGASPFQEAVLQNLPQVVSALAKKGVSVDNPLPDGMSPTLFATMKKYQNLLDALIKAGAMLDVRPPDGFTPLYLACKEGDIAAVSSLLKTNANINSSNGHNCLTPLMIATIEGHDEVAAMLIKQKGCNINQVDSGSWSALWHAVSDSNVQLACALLSAGADVNVTDTEGNTLLQEAVTGEQDDILALLKSFI